MKDAKWWREYRVKRGDSLRKYDRERKKVLRASKRLQKLRDEIKKVDG